MFRTMFMSHPPQMRGREVNFAQGHLSQYLFMKQNTKTKALVLFSGGLDSILAVKILQDQGVKTIGLTFKSSFFDLFQAKKAAQELGIELKVIDFSKEHFKIVKSPKYGYGKNLNPCIDCHLLMVKQAYKIMKKEKFDFIATGEVLGERPMSQNKKALQIIAKESGAQKYLLRPLSAKLLDPTDPEKKGLVKREKLFSINGRSRKYQIALAKKWKINWYPNPAGGCLLTNPEFSLKLKILLKNVQRISKSDLELLKMGRHFWEDKYRIIIGRDRKENKKLKGFKEKGDILIEMKNYPGPTGLIRHYGRFNKNKNLFSLAEKRAKDLVKFYSTKARDAEDVEFEVF